MRRAPLRRLLALLLGATLAAGVAAQSAAPAAKAAPKKPAAQKAPFKAVLEPRAVELLKAMSQRLAAAKSLSFSAVASYEYPSRLGPPIVYSLRYDVALQRPNLLRVIVPGDGPATEFLWDGKEMVAFAPAENLVAVASAPATLEAALKQAFDTAAIYFPFTDLLLPDPYAAISPGAVTAFVVGPSAIVGGVKTEMIVWANNDVFLQLWIGSEDKLPRRIRAQFRADPKGLRHDGPLPAEHFSTAKAKAKAGQAMAFAVPGRKVPVGARPVALQPKPKTAAKPQ